MDSSFASAAPRPRYKLRLRHQALLMVTVIMLAAMALLFTFTTKRMETAAIDKLRHWAEAVARTAAGAGAESLALQDLARLETTLREAATLPGVMRIDVLDDRSRPLLSLRSDAHGRVRGSWRGETPPGTSQLAGTHLTMVDGAAALQAWAEFGPGGTLGRVGVTFSLEDELAQVAALRRDAFVAVAAAGLLTTLAMYLLLSRALAPLQRVVRFSRALAARTGAQLEASAGSREVAELTEALNEASRQLRDQLEEIRRNEDRTHAIVLAVPDAVIGFDGAGLIGTASPAVASIFGREPAELAGHAIAALLPGLDAAEAERRTLDGMYMRASDTHVTRFETRAVRLGGTEFIAEVSLARRESADGVRYVCVARDVTDRRMADELLHLYGRALECTRNGIVISDMSMPGQPVFYANEAFSAITGYTVAEAIGRNCAFLQRGDTAQPELQQLRDAVSEGRSAAVVLRNYRKDGTLFFNELSIAPVASGDGRVRHYVGVLNDVTERERARMAIAERSARLNAVFDLSPDGFVVFDREGRLVFSNRAFQRMVGAIVGDTLEGLTIEAFDRRMAALCDPAQTYRPVAHALVDETTDTPDLLTLRMPEPRVLARVLRRQSDGLGETILFFRDITHETEVDRMKSEFLTTAAHELRTPMVSVYGFTELLLTRPVPDARRRDVLETIHRQASLLINMVNELLDLARIEARQGKDLRPEPCRLGALVQQAVDGLMVHGDPRRVRLQVAHAEAMVHVDAEKVLRALTNVLSNAYKYSPGGGDIGLATLDGTIDGPGGTVDAVGVRITDRGIGMSPAQLARVFERFFRADPSGNIPGTGLGMSLVKEIMDLHRGRVDIRSAPGQGSEVTLWLPLLPASVLPALPASA